MEVSRHAVESMQRRLDDPTVGENKVGGVWEESRTLVEFESGEKRYHEGLEITLESKDGVIRTVKTFNLDKRREYKECCWCGKQIGRNPDCKKCCGYKFEEEYD